MFSKRSIIFFIVATIILSSCNDLYKAGNRVTLDYPVDSKLSQSIVRVYIDSLIRNKYQAPPKWSHHNKLVDIDRENSMNIYFAESPEEMYLIQFNGTLLLVDVYNEHILEGDYIAKPERMPESEKHRILVRLQNEILSQVEQMAKRDGCPDSVLYHKPRYINGSWTDRPLWKPVKNSLNH